MHFMHVFVVLKQERIPFYRFARRQRSEKSHTKLLNDFHMLTVFFWSLI